MDKFSNCLIIERLKNKTGSKTDKELAGKLGVSASTLANWKSPTKQKPTLSELVFKYADENNISLDLVILGKEENTQDEMETELLARFAKLDFKQKLKLLTSLEDGDFAKNGTQQTAHGNGNNQQVFSGDVGEVVGIRK
ncbi:helix-turn-helix domain-containing protein [Glaesserella parasuis]|uniref:helix-turn-helix domain-containing protein n=1 Tax=Glaesserella parasuis TaxID=738 RepID=UPI001365E063|nr:helix-turn-helix domain-containing protein [Glaesserella parasuis]MDG6231823.1 helix-turn-helix domain-containing protein [Glaesserella parasuis]MDO9767383.1 helix-turn-helix domain-containing protein [Glaesserella parasuis]MWQ15148.1 hypothetical protein [Glaesserella parasuis]